MTSDLILDRIRRMILLDMTVFPEIRDDRQFTSVAAGSALFGILLAALGAALYGETVLDIRPNDWVLDTLLFGTLFTVLLLAAAITLIYVVLVQLFRVNVAPEELGRVLAFTFGFYGLGFFVFLPEVGFAAGLISIAVMFYYSVTAVRAITPTASDGAVALSVAAGFALWIGLMAAVSDPGDNFYTGVFVYSLLD